MRGGRKGRMGGGGMNGWGLFRGGETGGARKERLTLIMKFLEMMNLVLVLVVSVMAWSQLSETPGN